MIQKSTEIYSRRCQWEIPISLRPPLPFIFLFAIHLPPIEEGEFLLYPVKILFAPDIFTLIHPRACLKNAFRKMYVTICGRFCPDEGVVAGYGNRIRAKYTAKRGVQIAGMIFQTRSRTATAIIILYDHFIMPTGQIS